MRKFVERVENSDEPLAIEVHDGSGEDRQPRRSAEGQSF
jgi:hypothetical protein